MISSRYGVPRSALMQANGLSGTTLAPGSTVVIPVYNATASAAPVQAQPPVAAPLPRQTVRNAPVQAEARPAPPRSLPANAVAARPAPAPVAAPVARIATPPAIDPKVAAAAEAKARAAAEAKAKAAADAQAMRESRARFAAEAKAKAEARKAAAAAPAAASKPVVAEVKKPVAAPEKARPVAVASAPAETRVSAVPKSEPAPAPVAEPKTTASLPKQDEDSQKADFRWPARGRVIAGYSGKGGNEGINIAVPEGTPVKAAEGGTVAYAGNELKGYGNLVLIRHPNGYVSAYAHNGDLKVKRGDTVKRGQVVAQSGQTGNVSSPQLHFELRKGSSPVDPTPYLNN
jgi:murein DD-endopeptidase MepM/ murein hydrolase activator NlpD